MDSALINSSFRAFAFCLSNPRAGSSYYPSFLYRSIRNSQKLKGLSISVSLNPHSQPQDPISPWRKYSSSVYPFPLLLPFIHRIKNLARKASIAMWVSVLQGFSGLGTVPNDSNCHYLKSGGLGTALLSVTASARVRISPFVATLAANPTFMSGLFAWMVAQSMKVFLNFCLDRKWDLKLMFASGGMPSSHSALCTALTTSVAVCHGVADSLFPVCLGFSLIVMYDAIGVRRHAGMQAEVLNLILEDLFQGHPISQRKLKELLGHTPSQVLAGALLGILVACVCCQGYLVAI